MKATWLERWERILRPIVAGESAITSKPIELIFLTIIFGGIYGAVMGTFSGHWLQILYSAIKVPMMLAVSFALTLPVYFILNNLAGLRGDFSSALRAVAGAQAGLAITLASLCPFTALWYLSCANYDTNVLFNGLMFAISTGTAQALVRRLYGPLIDRDPKHRRLRNVWILAYSFVAIQMAWVLRPFVGNPELPAHFFRKDAWGNAYVFVGQMVWDWLRRF
jgi:hypothetical protein